MTRVSLAAVLATLVFMPMPAQAQEGCRSATSSCSQMNQTCERNCTSSSNNPSACIARACSAALSTCKATGMWKVGGSPACWRTNNRS